MRGHTTGYLVPVRARRVADDEHPRARRSHGIDAGTQPRLPGRQTGRGARVPDDRAGGQQGEHHERRVKAGLFF